MQYLNITPGSASNPPLLTSGITDWRDTAEVPDPTFVQRQLSPVQTQFIFQNYGRFEGILGDDCVRPGGYRLNKGFVRQIHSMDASLATSRTMQMVKCTRGVAVAVVGLSRRSEQWLIGGMFRPIATAVTKFVYLFDVDLECKRNYIYIYR